MSSYYLCFVKERGMLKPTYMFKPKPKTQSLEFRLNRFLLYLYYIIVSNVILDNGTLCNLDSKYLLTLGPSSSVGRALAYHPNDWGSSPTKVKYLFLPPVHPVANW